jgi:hypothetical protein
MFVFVDDAAESVSSADGQLGELVAVGDRFGQRHRGSGVGDALVRVVLLAEGLVLAPGV